MLVELRIGHLAIVDELTVPFGPGLTVLTGETGAGKSVVAGALGLLCGRQVPRDLVREGEECAWVEGVFDLADRPLRRDELTHAGVRVGADGVLVLRRELRLQGRSRVLINGAISSLALLERIGPRLLAIQSQDQQRELAEPAYARDLLDELCDAGELRREARAAWSEYRAASERLAARRAEEQAAAEQLELWRWQAGELAAAALRDGEDTQITEALALKRHAGALQAATAAALGRLEEGEPPALESLGAALAALRPVAGRTQRLAAALQELEGALAAATGAARELRRFLESVDLDATGLDELESRHALYQELQRKYRRDTAGLLALLAELQERIARQEAAQSDLADLAAGLEAARQRLETACADLHDRRARGAAAVARAAAERIRPLSLAALELDFAITPRVARDGAVAIDGERCDAGPDGADTVRLLVRTNRGERLGDVGGIASGGERSRIHLGLTALRRRDPEPPLLLCDEIDAGLGSDAARPVALLLRELSAAGQVVCITHLPTMAVHGDAHLRVAKTERDGRTVLRLAQLTGEVRVREIERLLGGETAAAGETDPRTSYAAALLAEAAAARGLRSGRFEG